MFNFRIINTADGNQIIDRKLKTPYSSLTPVQMLEYAEMEDRLAYMDRMEKKARQKAEQIRKVSKNPLYRIACAVGLFQGKIRGRDILNPVLNGREVDIMAYVLTNGNYYIRITENGGVAKTKDVNEAQIYLTMEKAKERLEKAPSKTKGYYILDIVTNEKIDIQYSKWKMYFMWQKNNL